MTELSAATVPDGRRHSWLERLIAAPELQVRALVEGDADIHPLDRAEPTDAAATPLFGLADDDVAVRAFDDGTLAALAIYRRELQATKGPRWERRAGAAFDLMLVVQRMRPRLTAVDLHRRFPFWNGWAETLVLDVGFDLRREYWRALALTQDLAAGAGLEARRLRPFWLQICGDAGRRGRFDETYLTVGLLGLRRLPLDEDGANEEAALHGLARWAEAQRPTKKRFLKEWSILQGAFPRMPTYWEGLVAKVLAAAEDALARKTDNRVSTFEAAGWWRSELDPVRGAVFDLQRGDSQPPDPRRREDILRNIGNGAPFRQLKGSIDAYVAADARHASRTGDTFYVVRTACNIGMRLLRGGDEPAARAEKARDLAQLALRFEPFNVFAWALWRDALAAMGEWEAAELLGWEAVRRFPENEQWRNQLASLLADRLDRATEAETLLRETMRLFPDDVVARTQLALLLADRLDRATEAETLLRETMRQFPDDVVARTELASIVGRDAARLGEALKIVDEALGIDGNNRVALDLKRQFEQGRPVGRRGPRRAPPRPAAAPSGRAAVLPADISATARARRALFYFRNGPSGAAAEARRRLSDDENLAYARYLAAAFGETAPSLDDTALAVAFLAATKAPGYDALRALVERAFGTDRFVIRLAGAMRGDEAAAAEIRSWLAEPANEANPHETGLRTLAAKPRAAIPMELLADMLAASQGAAFAA